MHLHVLAVAHQLKVLRSVVSLFAILAMHDFGSFKFSPEDLFHNDAMRETSTWRPFIASVQTHVGTILADFGSRFKTSRDSEGPDDCPNIRITISSLFRDSVTGKPGRIEPLHFLPLFVASRKFQAICKGNGTSSVRFNQNLGAMAETNSEFLSSLSVGEASPIDSNHCFSVDDSR